ncbi:Rubrerythrin [Magnetococcus marinus MC-1]|uniref:Rubrerythrin n=2 Tax=Magnetococcus TaxID=162171 RepID=A0L9R2_MAGMM|nr:Rubrerythrin [Magnetococcus marinus MC-1]
MGEGKTSSYEKLQSQKSLADILDVAIGFEQTAFDFYTQLTPKVGKPLRYLVAELAQEEQRHVVLFTELRNRPELEQQIREMVDTPESDSRFSDAVHLPELGENPDDQSVLQFAMGREHTAMQQYTALAESTPVGPIRDLFAYLADEEMLHKKELEKLYYQVVHSGGV